MKPVTDQNDVHWDEEWVQLITEAREQGLSVEEVRLFLAKKLHKEISR
ncbi:anti-repressor SinI family protein [Alteribacter lacisalsi]|nr:anti-repressor SinI family protein [Alteribacter lacisalsi]